MGKYFITAFLVFVTSLLMAQSGLIISPEHFQERVYLHTDKPYYYQEENIWFSAFMSYRSPGMADSLSKVLYVDLINAKHEIVQSRIVKLDSGRGASHFKLPNNLVQGNYLIRAYTNWMQNYGVRQFFYKPVPILSIHYTVKEKVHKTPIGDDRLIVHADKPVYKTREKVTLTVGFDQLIPPAMENATLSVAVTDETQVVAAGSGPTIFNDYLLPGQLPVDMLPKFTYPIETGIWLQGVYYIKKNKREKSTLTVVQDKLEGVYKVTTNDTGLFVLKDLLIYDSVKFLVNEGKGKTVLLPREVPPLPPVLPAHGLRWISTDTAQRVSYGNNIKTQMLKEVEVKSTRRGRQYENPYGQPDFYIKGENMVGYSSLALAITTKVPLFALTSSNGHYMLLWVRGMGMLGGGEPVVYIDNAQLFVSSGETVGDRLDSMNPFMIDHIEVGSMINSGMGANGASGAIYVYSKRYDPSMETPAPLVKIRGFDSPVVFEAPDYKNPATDTTLADFRSTIYWNPKVNLTSRKQSAQITFFTSDRKGKYRVIVEGIENKKIPVRAEVEIKVE